MTTAGSGLRERKKQATRAHIAAVATRLFVGQGFEPTTIAQIAERAEVAKMTVTNYFPLKEDLLFDRAPEIVALLADAVAGRPAGTTPEQAVAAVYPRRVGERRRRVRRGGRGPVGGGAAGRGVPGPLLRGPAPGAGRRGAGGDHRRARR